MDACLHPPQEFEPMNPSHPEILVIGATGGIGSAVAKAFAANGWRVRALSRRGNAAAGTGQSPGGIDWHRGDAMNPADVLRAAQGVDCIFHGANPPRYRRWRELALPMLAHSIEAARVTQARLIFPGNVYNYGADALPLVREDSPQHPSSRKGAVRVEMEQMLRDAAANGVRSLVVRAGDYFGAESPSSWFSTLLVKPNQALRSVLYPGTAGVGHAWAYLPDLAQAIVRLARIERDLPDFDLFNFGGHWMPRGVEMVESIRRASGNPALPVRTMPWGLLRLIAPFVPLLREMSEMRYLWQLPLQLDGGKLRSLIGPEPHTSLDEAVRLSLQQLGCLESGGAARLTVAASP
jgi:nucleoside-diphosphate-sugar epimerase